MVCMHHTRARPFLLIGILGSNIIQSCISFAKSSRGKKGTGSRRRIAWMDILMVSVKIFDGGPFFILERGFTSLSASMDCLVTAAKSLVL
jgi:hypothetical protein